MLRCTYGKGDYVYSVTKSIQVRQDVVLVFLGWRKKYLFPYVRDLILLETEGDKRSTETQPKGLMWALRMAWLAPVMTFVTMAVENNMDVVCSEESEGEASIRFLVE